MIGSADLQWDAHPAALAAAGDGSLQVYVWIGVLIAGAMIAGFLLRAFRNRWIASDPPPISACLSLHEIRAMRESGQISEEEFERLKEGALGGASHEARLDDRRSDVRVASPGFDLTGRPLPPAPPSADGEGGPDPDRDGSG